MMTSPKQVGSFKIVITESEGFIKADITDMNSEPNAVTSVRSGFVTSEGVFKDNRIKALFELVSEVLIKRCYPESKGLE